MHHGALCHGLVLGLASRGILENMAELARLQARITRPTCWQPGSLELGSLFLSEGITITPLVESTEYGLNTVWGQHPPQFPYPYNVPVRRIGCMEREHPSKYSHGGRLLSLQLPLHRGLGKSQTTAHSSSIIVLARCPVNLNPSHFLVSSSPRLGSTIAADMSY